MNRSSFCLVALLWSCSAASGLPDAGRDGGFTEDAGAEFPECEGLEEFVPYCPGMNRVLCRLEGLRQVSAAGCSQNEDCVLAEYQSNCVTYGLCEPRPAVLSTRTQTFAADIGSELAAYCARSRCFGGGSCAPYVGVAVCTQGRCEAQLR